MRGEQRYVVMTMAEYHRLHEADLAQAIRETRADYRAGRVADKNIKAHMKRLVEGKHILLQALAKPPIHKGRTEPAPPEPCEIGLSLCRRVDLRVDLGGFARASAC